MRTRFFRTLSATHSRRGSFADVAVVGACVLCILALIPAAVMQSREASREQRRSQSLHQMGMGMQSYHQTWNAFPAGGVRAPRPR